MLQGEIIIEIPKLAMEYKFEERDLAENEHRTINTYSDKIFKTLIKHYYNHYKRNIRANTLCFHGMLRILVFTDRLLIHISAF